MPVETEWKLLAPPPVLARLRGLGWLKRMAEGSETRRKLVSVYFDTPKGKLRRHGVSLRLRRTEPDTSGTRMQTVKRGDAQDRQEWETPIQGEQPDLGGAKATALAPLSGRKLRRRLVPLFETDVERRTRLVRLDRARIEIAFDTGCIRAGTRRAPLSEIELELKEGDPSALAVLAKKLAHAVALSYGARSKAERGYALVKDALACPVKAAPIVLTAQQSAEQGFVAIALSCLHHLAANEEAVRQGVAEGVHQMRVGLRRLRAGLSLFKEMLEGPETETVKRELKWLTEQLSPARDFEVLTAGTVKPLKADEPLLAELGDLERDLEDRRQAGFARARDVVSGARYRKLVLHTALWIGGGAWREDADPLMAARRKRPVPELARAEMDRRLKKIGKKIRKLEKLDDRGRHKLRIAVKKLRYGGDFFESLFAERKARKRFEKNLKTLQGALGQLTDIAVHRRLAATYAHPPRARRGEPPKAFAMGVVTGRQGAKTRACLSAADKAGKKLSRRTPFWH